MRVKISPIFACKKNSNALTGSMINKMFQTQKKDITGFNIVVVLVKKKQILESVTKYYEPVSRVFTDFLNVYGYLQKFTVSQM